MFLLFDELTYHMGLVECSPSMSMCVSSQQMTFLSVLFAWLRSAETRGTSRRKKRRMDLLRKVRKGSQHSPFLQQKKAFGNLRFVCTFRETDKLTSVLFAVNGEAEQVDFIDSSVTEEEEEEIRVDPPTPPLTALPLVAVIGSTNTDCVISCCSSASCCACYLRTRKLLIVSLQEKTPLSQTQDSPKRR